MFELSNLDSIPVKEAPPTGLVPPLNMVIAALFPGAVPLNMSEPLSSSRNTSRMALPKVPFFVVWKTISLPFASSPCVCDACA